MAKKLVKGQALYRVLLRIRGEGRDVEEVKVASVGVKYFTIEQRPDTRYLLATLKDEYGHNQLHLTEKEIRDGWERQELARVLRNVFDFTPVPLDVLQQVAALVPEQIKYLAGGGGR